MDIPTTSKVLKNGLKLIHSYNPKLEISRIEMFIRNGFLHEEKSKIGILHITEHLLAGFTSKKYPSMDTNRKRLNELNIDYNASTDMQVLNFYMQGLNTNEQEMFDIFLNTFAHPVIEKKYVNREKDIVIKEYEKILNNTWYKLNSKYDEILFKNTNCAIEVKKTKNNVQNITYMDLHNSLQKYYKTKYMMCYVVNNKKTHEVFNSIERYFGNYEEKLNLNILKFNFKLPKENIFYVLNKNVQNNYKIIFVYPLNFDSFSNEFNYLQITDTILTNDLNSRLYKILREKLGLIYGINSKTIVNPIYREFSYYVITTETSKEHVLQVVNITQEILKNLKNDKQLKKEIDIYRNNIKYQKSCNILDNYPSKYINFYSTSLLWEKKLCTLDEYYKQLLNVYNINVYLFAKKYLQHCYIFYSGIEKLI